MNGISNWRLADPRTALGPMASAFVLGAALLGCGGGSGPAGAGSGSGGSPAASLSGASSPAPGSTSTAGGGTAADACTLVTTEEVQTKAVDTVSKTEKGSTSCTWWLGSDQTSWIKLVVWSNGRATFDAMAPEGQAVAGLGDKAFSDGDTLVALKGATMLQLGSEIVTSRADPAAFTRPLMELALSRL